MVQKNMISRESEIQSISKLFKSHSIVGLLGPRQCGKTTLAKQYLRFLEKQRKTEFHLFDLEDPTDLSKLESPKLALENLKGLVIIDEVQKRPDLFPILRVLADRSPKKTRFLILGSASRELIRQSSESLAGRIAYLELTPFSLNEVHETKKLWLRGGFPPSYLAKTLENSTDWRKAFITTYLERDIPALGIQIPPVQLRKFWLMLSHYHGQIFNHSELARSMDVADTTIKRYLEVLVGTFMIRTLQPWFENMKKRQVKAPKIYFRDSGIFHTLLGIEQEKELYHHPKLGASWEGFALETVIRLYKATPEESYFWATHNQAELDLLILKGTKRHGFEFKYTDSPTVTKSMRIAEEDLKLDSLTLVYPGKESFPLDKKIQVVGLEKVETLEKLIKK